MANRVQRYRVSATAMAGITGREGELIVNLTRNSVHVHDGITAGGFELARADASNMQEATTALAGKMTATQVVALNTAVTNIASLTSDVAANTTALAGKPDKVTPSAAGNLAALAADGAIADSGLLITDAGLEAGTRALFQQSTPPTGWTKSTDHNDKALRLVSGSVVNGGATAFSSVFASTATGSHTLTAAQSGFPGMTVQSSGSFLNIAPSGFGTTGAGNSFTPVSITIPAVDASQGHTHSLDLRVQYADAIIAVKD